MRKEIRNLACAGFCLSLLIPATLLAQAGEKPWRDQGVLHLENSPHAKLRNVPVHAVTIQDGFWNQRRKVSVEKSLPSLHSLIEAHGYADNFRRLSKAKRVERKGPVFADTDLYKWIDAVGYYLQSKDRPELRAAAEEWIEEIVATQEPSGYLNTNFVGDRTSERLIPETMERGHELYNLGHMLQGAIAYYRATGNRRLLEAGIKYVEFLLKEYGPDKKPLLAGHPELEMALVELYRTTGDQRQLGLAGYLLNGDNRIERPPHRVVYTFSGIPFTERTKLQGHAVRAMYACSGAADYYLETGDKEYWKTLDNLWQDMVQGKMYITGGLGSRWTGEAFGESYELPNARAYAETCAAIGNVMWNWRMLAASGEARFADVLERALYNAVNVGMSLDGKLYCYRNPLESPGKEDPNRHSAEGLVRNEWYNVLCCPPNIQRTFGSLPGYLYSTSKDGIYLHLFHDSELDWHLENGTGLKVTQKTNYPWEGSVEVTVTPAQTTDFTFYLRIPGWTSSAQVMVNGQPVEDRITSGEYLPIRRRWQAGDKIQLEVDMSPQLIAANPRVRENVGRVAVERGPLVYCVEQLDQPAVDSLFDVSLVIGEDPAKGFRSEFRPEMLGGIMLLHHPGLLEEKPKSREPLYQLLKTGLQKGGKPIELTFIPYHAWANRTPSPMQVWIRYTQE